MKKRHIQSRGQALILVTLGLLAMCGIMGLAVDLGWSFFVKKEAQAAADAAAIGAVREASLRLNGNFSGFTCGSPLNNGAPYCAATAIDCSSLSTGSANNLENGCAYAVRNGFTSGSNNQKVTMQAGDRNTPPPTVPGLAAKTVAYWVTVRAVQSIPQLFSAVLGNKLGVVTAISTAAVVGTVVPGNLIALGKQGDCINVAFSNSQDCGVDININAPFLGSDQINATGSVIMASQCQGNTQGCSSGAGNAHAGMISNFISNNKVTSLTGIYTTSGAISVTGGSAWVAPGGVQAGATGTADPTTGEAQPALSSSSPLPTCGIQGGLIGNSNPGVTTIVGPYNYYACGIQNGKCIPTANGGQGAPIILKGNVTFEANGPCTSGNGGMAVSSGGNPQSSSAFPSYLFYGGLEISGVQSFGGSPTTSFGPGQYVMVGATPQAGSGNAGSVFSINSQTAFSQPVIQSVDTGGNPINANSPPSNYAGNMFVFTAPPTSGAGAYPAYPGLSTQINSSTVLQQVVGNLKPGSVDFDAPLGGTGQVNLVGVQQSAPGLPSGMDQYNAILFWQDRANSTVTYDALGHVTSNTSSVTLPTGSNAMNVFGLLSQNTVNLNGAIYQPRGAYLSDYAYLTFGQQSNTFRANVQLVTGAVELGGALGATTIQLGMPTNVLIKYTTGLIQ